MHAAVRTIDSMASAALDPAAGRIDGTHTPDELIEVIDITDAHEIVMATDGYIEPRRTLAESESPWPSASPVTCKQISHFASADSFFGRRRPSLTVI